MKKSIDVVGRIVIPKHMMEELKLSYGGVAEVQLKGDTIEISNPKKRLVKSELLTNLELLKTKYNDPVLLKTIDIIEQLL